MAMDNTYGALLIGDVIAAILYGFTCVQTYYYYTEYPTDVWYIKLLVGVVFALDTCHQALITHSVYTYIITNFGVAEQLGNLVGSLILAVFVNGFTTLFVQSFLAMRVHKLSGNSWFATGSVMVLVVVQFVMVMVYASRAIHYETFVQLAALKNLSMMINVTAAAGDIIIALFLCGLLQRSRTGFQKSDTMISKLIVFSINTGLLTSIDALASLVCIITWPHTFIYIAFYFSIGKLYCNSLLATLNARKGLRGESAGESISLCQPSERVTTHSKFGTTLRHTQNNISIKVDTTHEFIREECSSTGDVQDPGIV